MGKNGNFTTPKYVFLVKIVFYLVILIVPCPFFLDPPLLNNKFIQRPLELLLQAVLGLKLEVCVLYGIICICGINYRKCYVYLVTWIMEFLLPNIQICVNALYNLLHLFPLWIKCYFQFFVLKWHCTYVPHFYTYYTVNALQ